MAIDLEKIVSNVKFVYGLIAAFVTSVAAVVTFYVQNSELKTQVKDLKTSNTTLVQEVASLQGAMDGVNKAVALFTTNSPALLNYRIDELQRAEEYFHGSDALMKVKASNATSEKTFKDRPPH